MLFNLMMQAVPCLISGLLWSTEHPPCLSIHDVYIEQFVYCWVCLEDVELTQILCEGVRALTFQ